jgi:hypothetical protein
MEKLQNTDALLVQQKKEWGEILTGFETKNKYAVTDVSGNQLYWAAEESSFLSRLLLKTLRPFTMHVLSSEKNSILKLNKPFRFFFHEMNILDSEENLLGTIKREFSLLSRKFTVKDQSGIEIYKIYGPILHLWTFKILKYDQEVGRISKKWSGLGKEMFTDADKFNIAFPNSIDVNHKGILMGALFLIDMLFFEKSK